MGGVLYQLGSVMLAVMFSPHMHEHTQHGVLEVNVEDDAETKIVRVVSVTISS